MLEWLAEETPPEVVQLPNALLASLAPPLHRTLKRPIHCTLQGEDLFLDGLAAEHRTASLELIRQHAGAVDRFTAVSEYYAAFMATYLSIPRSKIDVVPLGINLAGFERRRAPQPDRPFAVGYLARIAPEKGLARLCDAYVRFRQMAGVGRARLEVAGYIAPDQQGYLTDARGRLERAGLGAEFHFRGTLDRAQKIEFLKDLDVFSVPTVYVEPKGLFLLEAMACGVPVVQPRHGAFPEMIEKTAGGLLVEPNDAESLAGGLYRLWKSPDERARFADSGYEGVRRYYGIARSADRMLEVYKGGGTGAGARAS